MSIFGKHKQLFRAQKGMVSIITVMVMIIVISLIVLGFAQISRRNQRESLDRQLSTQAFYAAESGINEARDLISTAVAGNTTVPDKSGCTDTGPGGFYASLAPVLDTTANVRYSCLLVDASPTELQFSDVGTESIVIPVLPEGGANLSSIQLRWQSKLSGNPLTGCPTTLTASLSPATSWSCGYGVLRFDLVRTDGNFTTNDLYLRNMTSFVVPFASGATTSSVPYNPGTGNANTRIAGSCTTTGCSLDISGLNTNAYYMRISSLYRNVALQVTARNAANALVGLANVQARIDATGRAQDVLRRIQVSVPLRSSSKNEQPDYAIQSTDAICKRFVSMDGYFDTIAPGVSSSNRLCQP